MRHADVNHFEWFDLTFWCLSHLSNVSEFEWHRPSVKMWKAWWRKLFSNKMSWNQNTYSELFLTIVNAVVEEKSCISLLSVIILHCQKINVSWEILHTYKIKVWIITCEVPYNNGNDRKMSLDMLSVYIRLNKGPNFCQKSGANHNKPLNIILSVSFSDADHCGIAYVF